MVDGGSAATAHPVLRQKRRLSDVLKTMIHKVARRSRGDSKKDNFVPLTDTAKPPTDRDPSLLVGQHVRKSQGEVTRTQFIANGSAEQTPNLPPERPPRSPGTASFMVSRPILPRKHTWDTDSTWASFGSASIRSADHTTEPKPEQ
ncbi:hypothetical protein IAT40_005193 [Kwoniella sp. CBS 6097]